MILQKMDVASKMLGAQVTEKAFVVSLVQFVNFGHLYKDAVVEYQNEYFADRTNYIHCNFTSCMIAISNNCDVFQVGIFIRQEKLLKKNSISRIFSGTCSRSQRSMVELHQK